MAAFYLRSTDGSDADNGTTWALAKATLAGAIAVMAAGDTLYIADGHAETLTGGAVSFGGSAASPTRILVVDDTGNPEPPTTLATGATLTAPANTEITMGGFSYVYGLTLVGTRSLGCLMSSNNALIFESCTFSLTALFNSGIFRPSTNHFEAVRLRAINCTYRFSAVTQGFDPGPATVLLGGSVDAGGTIPTALFLGVSLQPTPPVRVIGMDLSALTSGKSLVGVGGNKSWNINFENCKLGASVALTSGTNPGPGGSRVTLDNCDSADTQYRMQRHQYEGDVYSETTVVRTGGASNGTTPLAHKMVSSAGARFTFPFYGPEMVIYNAATGSAKTATVEIVHDSLTALTDAEVWLEVEYLGTAGFPLSLFLTDRAADLLATPADQTVSTIAWTTTGITNVNKQKLAVTFTPQEIGLIRCRVAVAKPSYTVYVDPLLTVA